MEKYNRYDGGKITTKSLKSAYEKAIKENQKNAKKTVKKTVKKGK